jgi:hypothetical protein
MTGLRDAPGVPLTGWRRRWWRGRIDLGQTNEVCEWCGIQRIRHVNVMTHPDWPHGPVRAGNDCAEDMSGENARGWRLRAITGGLQRLLGGPDIWQGVCWLLIIMAILAFYATR